jgi:hypothetical protein
MSERQEEEEMPIYVGMNNYEDYDPEWCDGHYCPRDCENCEYSAENRGISDYGDDNCLEMGFDPYEGCYTYDC